MSAVATAGSIRDGGWAGDLSRVAPGSSGQHSAGVSIASWALAHVQPLKQWWDELLGDPAAVAQVAESWNSVETVLAGVAEDLRRECAKLDALEGRTVRTLTLRYEDLNPVAQDAAECAGAVAAAARLASNILDAIRSFLHGFLDQLAHLINELFGFSWNPLDKVGDLKKLSSAATELIREGQKLLTEVFDAFQSLIELIEKLLPLLEEALTTLREAIATMIPAAAVAFGLPGMIVGGIARDSMMDIGDVERYDIDELRRQAAADPTNEDLQKKIDAWEKANSVTRLDSLADLVEVNGTTDVLGGAESSAIDIKLLRAPDGTEHWVVSLPSTQEWLDLGGEGAMNDGKNNLPLLFDSPAKTQYERAVLRAMREAGMSPGDPVVFTGFSQGGIMAANLASDPGLPYRPIGVVTNGAPIDTFDIPPNVPVVSFQHETDPVARLDFGGAPGTPPNIRRLVLGNPPSGPFSMDVHSNDEYVRSIRREAGEITEDYSWMGGDVVDHQLFSATQR